MPAADMTPEREEQLTADLLRERAGIDPGNAGQLADLAAIGLVNGAWRNTCARTGMLRREPRAPAEPHGANLTPGHRRAGGWRTIPDRWMAEAWAG